MMVGASRWVSVPRSALGAVDDIAGVGARRSVGDRRRFRSDLGGAMSPVGFGAPYNGSLAPLNVVCVRVCVLPSAALI
jgi:hypothetical protein